MNLPIFVRELKQFRAYTLIWVIVLVFSTGANIAGSAGTLTENPTLTILDVFQQSVINMTMMCCIFSMILGGLVISREEDEKTVEFLLSNPVTRFEVAFSKFVALTALIGIFYLVLLAADFAFCEIFKGDAGYNPRALLGIWLSEFVLVFLYGGAGILFSSFITKGGAVVGAGIGIPIVTGILAALGNVDNLLLEYLSYLSPIRYLDAGAIVEKGAAQPVFVLVVLAIAAVFYAISFILYRRREFAV